MQICWGKISIISALCEHTRRHSPDTIIGQTGISSKYCSFFVLAITSRTNANHPVAMSLRKVVGKCLQGTFTLKIHSKIRTNCAYFATELSLILYRECEHTLNETLWHGSIS